MNDCSSDFDFRPREELITYGAHRVSTLRLLSIVLGSGSKRRPVETLASLLLSECGGLVALSQASVAELCAHDGIGEALATRLAASFQLGKRVLESSLPATALVRGPDDIYARLRGRLASLDQEVFVVLALDVRGRIVDEIEVARGSLSAVEVHPREVFRPLIRRAAYACVVAHNHPSGDPTPSPEDFELTRRLQDVGRIVGIELLDHVVVASGGYSSMADRLHTGIVDDPEELQ
ncbi:MAG: DNA repair protein RadC [Myxococcales bacterium]|nr:DNA repair protein RadC [Myxococcales bacterium]